MKERPIVFSDEMVRAILEGRKTMTRRLVKHPQLTNANELDKHFGGGACEDCDACFYADPKDSSRICLMCPYGKPGDRLWVKERFRVMSDLSRLGVAIGVDPSEVVAYEANGEESALPWTASRFMPRWASRILLEIVSVRVERVQDISPADTYAEGVGDCFCGGACAVDCMIMGGHKFAQLWNTIHAKKPESQWDANPWVWVIEFKVATP